MPGHPELPAPPPLQPGVLRIVALGGIGEIGRNMAVLEIDGRLLVVDCGVLFPEESQPGVDLILPDFSYIRDRLGDIDAVILTHGHEDHIGAVPFLLRMRADIPLVGSRLTLAMVEAKLREHRIKAYSLEVREGAARAAGPVQLRVLRRQPLHPRRPGRGDPDGRRHGGAHRRLQDGPAAPRRPDHRPARAGAARRRGHRPGDGRLHQRRGARIRPGGDRHRPSHRPGVRPCSRADHRGQLRLARASHPAGARRLGQPRPQGRVRRPLHGAQHERRPGPRLPRREARAGGPFGQSHRPARRPGRARLHRIPGRADGGAVADRQR